jgi:hypothetical protein
VLLDEERDAMAKSRRLERSTNSFSYSSYHTLDEVGPSGQALDAKASEFLGIARIRQRPEKDSETIETVTWESTEKRHQVKGCLVVPESNRENNSGEAHLGRLRVYEMVCW